VARALHLEPTARTKLIIQKLKFLRGVPSKNFKLGDKKSICGRLNEIQDQLSSDLVAELDTRLCATHPETCQLCNILHDDIGAHFCDFKLCQHCNLKYNKSHQCPIERMTTFNAASTSDDDNFIKHFFDTLHLCSQCGECAGKDTVQCRFCRPRSSLMPEPIACFVCDHPLTHLDELEFCVPGLDGEPKQIKMTSLANNQSFQVKCHQCYCVEKYNPDQLETCTNCCRKYYTPSKKLMASGECNDCVRNANYELCITHKKLLNDQFGKVCALCGIVNDHIEGDDVDEWCKL